jgi:hypothetical protein
MQCWYWAALGVGSVVAQTANAAAVIASRIGFSLLQALPSGCKVCKPAPEFKQREC